MFPVRPSLVALAVIALWLPAPCAPAQNRVPQIGYLYPAGGRQGTTVPVTVGGQYLNRPTSVLITGNGIRGAVLSQMGRFTSLNRQQQYLLLQRIWEIQEKHLKRIVRFNNEIKKIQEAQRERWPWRMLDETVDTEGYELPNHPLLIDLADRSFRELIHIQNHFFFPRNKLQDNRQISEHVLIEIKIARNAVPGIRELRLQTANGVSSPVRFQVGTIPESSEAEPNTTAADEFTRLFPKVAERFPTETHKLPLLINGQIMPGDIDRFRFLARKGQTLIVRASARDLIPFLADAVPGWFQAVLSIHDADGDELAFVDDSGFSPDPQLRFKVPVSGPYEVAIRDAIYRGRQDFVYRLSITDAASRDPLPATAPNVPEDLLAPAVGSLQRPGEKEPNNHPTEAQSVALPHVLEGTIATPHDVDMFRFKGRKDATFAAEVHARRIGSPLDSLVRLMDASGKVVAWNDDHVLKEKHLHVDHTGVTTHHADSYVIARLPYSGTYYVQVSDAQRHGSAEHRYQLRLGPARPDYALRVTPSSLCARRGETIPITVHAIRRDGFDAEIEISPRGAPRGTIITGGTIPTGANQARMTLSVPRKATDEPLTIRLEGRAKLEGKTIRRTAVAADKVMQAFLWRHILPAQDLLLDVREQWQPVPDMTRIGKRAAVIPVGGRVPVKMRIDGPFRVPEDDRYLLRIDQPPQGFSIDQDSIHTGSDEWSFDLVSDSSAEPTPFGGNLIVQIVRDYAPRRADGTRSRKRLQTPVGYLPAIPIQVGQ